MATSQNGNRKEHTDSALPKPKKNGWLYIYTALGMLAVVALVLATIFRELPRRNAIVKRNHVPLVQGVYTLALSPIDSATARMYTERIAQKIGADSAATKMVVGSTHVAQQFISFADFRRATFEACVNARPAKIRTQQVLTANIANMISSDQLPSTLYIIGELGTENFTDVEKYLTDAINALQIRNQLKGPLTIISYSSPDEPEVHRNMTAQFLNIFRERGMDVKSEDALTVQKP